MPPQAKEMLEQLDNVWLIKDLWGENSGPITWFSQQYIENVAANCLSSKADGIFGYRNTFWEAEDLSTVSQHVNLICFASALYTFFTGTLLSHL